MKKPFYYEKSIQKKYFLKDEVIAFCTMLLIVFPTLNVFATGKNVNEDKFAISIENQQREVTGVITSATGEPLVGASVSIKDTSKGVVTDFDGNYTLEIDASNDVILVFSYLGFQTKEIAYTGQDSLNVSLEEDASQLDEVVVVGYGSVKKSDLTGAVSQVKSDEITAYPAAGISQALQGRAAGVQVTSNNGEPGGGYKVRIRGGTSISSSSDPLYVVDGFPGGTLPPPEDIESIEILKDASSTAIYGSRGANGVILVTTKKGKAGKTKIELSTSYSIQTVANKIDLLNGEQMAEYVNDVFQNNGAAPRYSNPSSYGEGTDWQDKIFTDGFIQNHQLSVSGGNEDVKYYISGSMFDEKGVILNSGFSRYSITSNINLKASEKFKIGANLFARRSEQEGVRTQETNGGTTPGVIGSALRFEPMLDVYDDNGVYTLSELGSPYDNPVAVVNELVNEDVADRFQGNFYGEYAFLPELKFRAAIGANTYNDRRGEYIPSTLSQAKGAGGMASILGVKNTSIISENYLSFNKEFGKHNISAIGGYSYQKDQNTSWLSRSNGFITDSGSFWNLGQGSELQVPASSKVESELSSFYGRANYKLSDKYLVTFTARYDGSSRFAKNNKWAFFPSGALAWNVSKEDFMKDIDNINQLKIRASYGVTGNQAIQPYQSLARFSSVLSIIDGNIVNAVRPTDVANNDLSWESTTQTDIGFDLSMFNNRLTLNADYYQMTTSDLLFSRPLPQYSGYSSQLWNIGDVENKGFELTISSINIDRELRWDTQFNISTNKNKVTELPEGSDILYGTAPGHMVGLEGGTNILRVGEPVGSFYGYTYDGVLQSDSEALPGNFETNAGGEKYKDINGDGEITTDDRGIIGNPHPDFIWSLNNSFSYKNFDLNVFFMGSQGNDVYSYSLMELDLMAGLNNATTNALNRWTPTNTNTDVPIAKSRSRISSSRFVYDGSFVKLKNLSLGYNFNDDILTKLKISSLRLHVSGQDILTITDYPGFDPEVNFRTSGTADSNRNIGLDYGSYPNSQSVTFGLTVGF